MRPHQKGRTPVATRRRSKAAAAAAADPSSAPPSTKRRRTSTKTTKEPASGSAQPPSPSQDAVAQEVALGRESILEGIYQRMLRDGLLPSTMPAAQASPSPPGAISDHRPAHPAATTPEDSSAITSEPTTSADQRPASALNGAISALLKVGSHTPGSEIDSPLTTTAPAVFLSSPIAGHVSQKLKDKIWAGRAIDMGVLLPRFDVWTDSESDDEERSRKPSKRKQRRVLAIGEFCTAFQIYTAVMAERFPELTAGLLKHLATVQRLAQERGQDAWRRYDSHFRKLKEHNHNLLWGQVHLELYTEVSLATPSKEAPTRPFRDYRQKRDSYPRHPGTCWPFQRDGFCNLGSKCRFTSSHKCHKCGGAHATRTCKPGRQPGNNKPRPTNANKNHRAQ